MNDNLKFNHSLIVGGGIGGLTLAIILAQRGRTVEVFEQAVEFDPVGAGIQQSPNAMHIHTAIGTAQAVIKAGFEPSFAALRDYATGTPYLTTPLKGTCRAQYGQPYIHIHRADLHAILLSAAQSAGVAVHMDHQIQDYKTDDNQVTLQTQKGRYSGDLLIGADGIKSTVRRIMQGDNPDNSAATFTGHAAWRGLVPAAAWPKDMLPPAANVWMGPRAHFVAYYVKGGDYVNFIAVQEQQDWQDESWSVKGDIEALRRAFKDWDPVVGHIIKACKACYLWGLFDHTPLARWSDGPVTLLGDAAHPMLPFMAQGAAMAIEDAWVLAQKILTTDDITHALKAYEAARKPRASKLQAISRSNAKLFHTSSPARRLMRNNKLKLANALPPLQHMKLGPIYGVNLVKDYPL